MSDCGSGIHLLSLMLTVCILQDLYTNWDAKLSVLPRVGILLQLKEIDKAPENEADDDGKENSDEEKHQVELKKTQ